MASATEKEDLVMEDDLEDLYGGEVSTNDPADPIKKSGEAGDEQTHSNDSSKDPEAVQLPGVVQPAESKTITESHANLAASEVATKLHHDNVNTFEEAKIKTDDSNPSEEAGAKVIHSDEGSQDLPGNSAPQNPQRTHQESTQTAAQYEEEITNALPQVGITTRTNVSEIISQSKSDMLSNRGTTAMEVDSKPESNDLANLAVVGSELINGKNQENAAIKGPSQENAMIGEGEWEADSSPYESSSDDSSESSSSDSDEDGYKLLDPAEQARRLMEEDGNSDEEGGSKGAKGGHIKSHNERIEEVVEKPDITITPDMAIEELGGVEAIVDNVVVIRAKTSGEYQVLESRSLLCLADRTVIGVVSETLGRVREPLYCVRFSTPSDIERAGITRSTRIHYVPQHSTFVFTRALQAVKGSDASNIHDEEVGDEEAEFSDDEAEAEYKRSLKAQKQARRLAKSGPQTTTYANGYANGADPSSTINYDDAPQDDLYTPLSRPANLHEMMDHGPGAYKPSTRGHRGNRGRGDRGHHRGRGDRGGMRPRQHMPPERGPQPPLPHQLGAFPSAPFYPSQQEVGPASSTSAQASSNGYAPPFPNLLAAHGYHQPPGPPSHFSTGYSNYYMPPQYANAQVPHQNSWPGQQPHSGHQNSHTAPAYPPSSGPPTNAQPPSGVAINPRFFQSQYPSQNGS